MPHDLLHASGCSGPLRRGVRRPCGPVAFAATPAGSPPGAASTGPAAPADVATPPGAASTGIAAPADAATNSARYATGAETGRTATGPAFCSSQGSASAAHVAQATGPDADPHEGPLARSSARALPLSPPRGEPLSTFHPVVVGEPGGAVKETGFRVEHRDGSRLGASLTHGPDGVGASAEVVRKGTTVTGSIQQTPAGQVVSVGGQVDRRDGTRVGATVTHGPDGVGASAEVVRKGTTVTGSIQQTPAGQVVSVGGQVDRRDGTRVGATVTHGPDGVGASAEVGLHSGTKVRAGVDPGPQGPKVDAELVIPFP